MLSVRVSDSSVMRSALATMRRGSDIHIHAAATTGRIAGRYHRDRPQCAHNETRRAAGEPSLVVQPKQMRLVAGQSGAGKAADGLPKQQHQQIARHQIQPVMGVDGERADVDGGGIQPNDSARGARNMSVQQRGGRGGKRAMQRGQIVVAHADGVRKAQQRLPCALRVFRLHKTNVNGIKLKCDTGNHQLAGEQQKETPLRGDVEPTGGANQKQRQAQIKPCGGGNKRHGAV